MDRHEAEALLTAELFIPVQDIVKESVQKTKQFEEERAVSGFLSEQNPEIFERRMIAFSRFHHEVLRHTEELKDSQVDIFLKDMGFDISSDNRSNVWRLRYLIGNYTQIKRIISGTISKFEGHACSVDKFSTLLSFYSTLEIEVRQGSSEVPFMMSPITPENSWAYVSEGSLNLWVKYLDSLPHMSSGNMEVMVEAYNNLSGYYKKQETGS